MKDTYLRAENITKYWKNKKISISLKLEKGDTLALLGDSGAGKTTILKMIAGLLKIDAGKLYLDGKDITEVPAGKRGIGMVFQDYALFPNLNVEDNISYGLFCRGMAKKRAREEIKKWLILFELSDIAKSYPDEISGGQKQRVSLARSIAVGNNLILFDEALSALDSRLREKLQNELKEHQKKLKFSAIYVTHDEKEATILANNIIYIK